MSVMSGVRQEVSRSSAAPPCSETASITGVCAGTKLLCLRNTKPLSLRNANALCWRNANALALRSTDPLGLRTTEPLACASGHQLAPAGRPEAHLAGRGTGLGHRRPGWPGRRAGRALRLPGPGQHRLILQLGEREVVGHLPQYLR